MCEVCGKTENLHLHHVKLFSEIVSETLKVFKLHYTDTNHYTDAEFNMIIDSVIGKHICIEYLTLCNGCHIKIHESSKRELNVNNKHIQYYEILRQKESLAKGKYIKSGSLSLTMSPSVKLDSQELMDTK